MSEEAGEYKTGRIKTGQMIPPKEQSPLLTGTAAQPQEEELVKHQAEAWCSVVADLMLDHGLTSAEPGKIAVDQVRNFLKRTFTSLDFYKRRCQEFQRVQSMMRDPERKMVCDILANGTTYMKGRQCRLVQGSLFDRWILMDPEEKMGWSGSRWVPVFGDVQVSNFDTRDDANQYAVSQGFEVLP